MFRTLAMWVIAGSLCTGCDTARRQQQTEDVRSASTAAKLKQLGEGMHNNSSGASPADESANDSR